MKTILFFAIVLLNLITVKSQYLPEWVKTYNFEAGTNVFLHDAVVDANNNLYVTGTINYAGEAERHIITLKYNSSGVLQWSHIYIEPGSDSTRDLPKSITIDGAGNAYVFGKIYVTSSNFRLKVLKYNSIGNQNREFTYNVPPNCTGDLTNAITDNQGNSYLAGRIRSDIINKDTIILMKLNSNFDLLWSKRTTTDYTSFYFESLNPVIDFDNNGNIVLSAERNDALNSNILTQKYDVSGTLLWSSIYDDNGLDDIPFDIKSDNFGNVFVTGTGGSALSTDSGSTLLLKYASDGTQQWVRTARITSNVPEYGYNLATDNSGSVYVLTMTGNIYLTPGHDIIFRKYSENGSLIWQNKFGLNNNYEIGNSVIADSFGDPLIAGTYNNYGHTKLLLLKYNKTNGDVTQVYSYNQNDTSKDSGVKILQGTSGNVFISGNSDNNFLNMKLGASSTHTQSLTNHVNKPINDNQSTYDTISITTDMLPAFAYVTDVNMSLDTILHSAISDLEILLIHGNYSDTLVYRRGGFADNFIGTHLDDTATINICNTAAVPYTGFYAPCMPLERFNSSQVQGPWILKIYDRRSPDTGVLRSWTLNVTYQTLIGLTQVSSQVPKTYLLSQNYPNPFNPVTKIKFSIPKSSQVKIVIYDLLGKEIETLVDQQLTPGEYETDFDGSDLSSGVYFYKFISGEFAESRKMVLIK